MDLYAVVRRSGRTAEDLAPAGEPSARARDEAPEHVRWIRDDILNEGGGAVGTVCLYEATSPEAIREHISREGLPADEIVPIVDMVLVRAC
jgi:Protein of unknown function (DUF4242)